MNLNCWACKWLGTGREYETSTVRRLLSTYIICKMNTYFLKVCYDSSHGTEHNSESSDLRTLAITLEPTCDHNHLTNTDSFPRLPCPPGAIPTTNNAWPDHCLTYLQLFSDCETGYPVYIITQPVFSGTGSGVSLAAICSSISTTSLCMAICPRSIRISLYCRVLSCETVPRQMRESIDGQTNG